MLEYKSTEQFLNDYRNHLKEKGITNAHVARKIGMSPQQLQNVFKKQELTVSDVIKLCNGIEVRQVYKISSVGAVAGAYVLSGKVTRQCQIRVVRDGIVIAEDKMSSLKRFKDDVKEVTEGYECGITLEKFRDFKEGDIFEAFIMEEYQD